MTENLKGGTQNFRSPARPDLHVSSEVANRPGPSDYAADNSPKKLAAREAGKRRPFGINTKRFGGDDNGVPGAGKYDQPDSLMVRNPKQVHASFKSKLDKGPELIIGRDNPGIGEYDT